MSPESSEPSFRTMWWTTLSVLCHTNRVPWVTDAGLGEKDWAPLWPTMVIVVAEAGGAGLPLPPEGPPLEPPQCHAASVVARDAASSEAHLVIFLVMTRGVSKARTRARGRRSPGLQLDQRGELTADVTGYGNRRPRVSGRGAGPAPGARGRGRPRRCPWLSSERPGCSRRAALWPRFGAGPPGDRRGGCPRPRRRISAGRRRRSGPNAVPGGSAAGSAPRPGR